MHAFSCLIPTQMKVTSLHIAVSAADHRRLEMIKALIKAGADIDAQAKVRDASDNLLLKFLL